ncbi:acyl carrier protein [Streptomyces sp. NPDC057545]|uniref:acyl carrier protein n=1 Tax=Streptomyces sp. NPDC057545 TaxID=3346164 RepID=UPI00367F8D2E
MPSKQQFTLQDLKRILLASAGVDESTDLDGDILDEDFATLGYDSLAILETLTRIERERGITLADSVATEARTPRALVRTVNERGQVGSALG